MPTTPSPHPDGCDDAGVKHPTIVRERPGDRAYHSVLIFNVLGVSAFGRRRSRAISPDEAEQPHRPAETYTNLSAAMPSRAITMRSRRSTWR
jgi:arginine decarboxylase-like protein